MGKRSKKLSFAEAVAMAVGTMIGASFGSLFELSKRHYKQWRSALCHTRQGHLTLRST